MRQKKDMAFSFLKQNAGHQTSFLRNHHSCNSITEIDALFEERNWNKSPSCFLWNLSRAFQFKHLFHSVPGGIYGRVQCLFLVSFFDLSVCWAARQISVQVRLLRFRSNSIIQRSTQKYPEYHTHDPDMLPIAASNSISRARLLADTGFGGNRPPVS